MCFIALKVAMSSEEDLSEEITPTAPSQLFI